MKKMAATLAMVIIATALFCQNSTPALTKDYYLQKSKKQKTTAKVLLFGGGVLLLTAFVIPRGELVQQNWIWYDEYKNDGIKGGFGLTGTLAMLGSIPFFIASSKNERRAISVSFKNQNIPVIFDGDIVSHAVPSVSIKIKL